MSKQNLRDDEDEAGPALLTSRMIPLIRQVKKGDEMQVLLAGSGKEVAVMLSRRPIPPSGRKVLADYLAHGAPRYFPGTCVFEAGAYTFVLKTQAGGMAKKIKAALLRQIELRLKVRVRGVDPDDIDDDGDPAEDEVPDLAAGATQGDASHRPDALDAWRAKRAEAVATLKSVAGELAAARHPSSARAILEIQQLVRSLRPEPATRAEVQALRQWLDHDPVLRDICELFGDFRMPLRDALQEIHDRLDA